MKASLPSDCQMQFDRFVMEHARVNFGRKANFCSRANKSSLLQTITLCLTYR